LWTTVVWIAHEAAVGAFGQWIEYNVDHDIKFGDTVLLQFLEETLLIDITCLVFGYGRRISQGIQRSTTIIDVDLHIAFGEEVEGQAIVEEGLEGGLEPDGVIEVEVIDSLEFG
jgi:hypothetical protein